MDDRLNHLYHTYFQYMDITLLQQLIANYDCVKVSIGSYAPLSLEDLKIIYKHMKRLEVLDTLAREAQEQGLYD
jgi:hypothetical protein